MCRVVRYALDPIVNFQRELGGIKLKLQSSWERFVLYGEKDNSVRKEVFESWNRCKQLGVPYELESVSYPIDQHEFSKRKQSNRILLNAALPVIKELSNKLSGSRYGYILVLADSEGYLLETMANKKAQKFADRQGIYPGVKWTEDHVGTTALSMALRNHSAIAVSTYENYCKGFQIWDGAAYPIIVDREILGVFDICRTESKSDMREINSISVASAQAITERIRYYKSKIRQEIIDQTFEYSSNTNLESTGVILFDTNSQVIHKNKVALNFVNLLKEDNERDNTNLKSFSILNHVQKCHGETGEIILQDKPYFIESKELTLKGSNIGTLVFIKEQQESEKKYFHLNKSPIENQSQIDIKFQTQNTHFLKTINIAKRVAKSSACILLQGETGSGKDFLARAIHEESARRNKPFFAINCAAFPRELISAELFGYDAGAFTGAKQQGNRGIIESANGGTVLLDEIADMPLDLQVVLLRTLEEKQIIRVGSSKPIPVDVRFIAATHKDLKSLVKEKAFRDDLYYRLSTFTINIPSLRERLEDLHDLIKMMVTSSCKPIERKPIIFTPAAIEGFKKYLWPGNLRELRSIIERITYLHDEDIFDAEHVEQFLEMDRARLGIQGEETEEKQIRLVLNQVKGNRAEAARKLNISRSALYRKLEKYKIDL